MDIRYSANPKDVKRYTTQELRDEFLIQNLYQPDTVRAVYSHVDRMVVLGISDHPAVHGERQQTALRCGGDRQRPGD